MDGLNTSPERLHPDEKREIDADDDDESESEDDGSELPSKGAEMAARAGEDEGMLESASAVLVEELGTQIEIQERLLAELDSKENELSRQRELLVGEAMSTAWMRASIVAGWESGTRAMTVGMGVGPALTVVSGGASARQWWWSPGVRGALTLRVPLAHDWQMLFSAGLTTRRWSGDVDLSVGWGHRW